MSPRTWRNLAVVVIALGIVLAFGDLVASAVDFDLGYRAVQIENSSAMRFRVIQVVPHGEAERVGIRPGDIVSLADDSYFGRARFSKLGGGQPIELVVRRASAPPRTVTLTSTTVPAREGLLLQVYDAIRLTMLAVALVLAIRRPERPEVRALAGTFAAFGWGFGAHGTWEPVLALYPLAASYGFALFAFVEEALRFATMFPERSRGGVRAWLERANVPIFATLAVGIVAETTLSMIFGYRVPAWLETLIACGWLFYSAAITLAFVIANRLATGVARQRSLWISLSLAAGFSGIVAGLVTQLLGIEGSVVKFLPLTCIAAPLGMGYAILRHRVLDVGFAINRAVVFGAVSATVVLALAALEWSIQKYLSSVGHVTGAALDLGVALVLGLFLKRIHTTIDRFIDDLFFRARHRNVDALRKFSHE
jgi:hypothetical protein